MIGGSTGAIAVGGGLLGGGISDDTGTADAKWETGYRSSGLPNARVDRICPTRRCGRPRAGLLAGRVPDSFRSASPGLPYPQYAMAPQREPFEVPSGRK